MLQLNTVVRTAATGGIVFDMYSPTDFKWAAVSVATQQVLIGHYTAKGGWVVDAAVSRTLSAGTDYALGVTLKGSTVNVTLERPGGTEHGVQLHRRRRRSGHLCTRRQRLLRQLRVRDG